MSSNKSALCRITSLAFSFALMSHTHWLRCDFFFLFPRLYNLNDCAHHHCSYIPWSSTDVASVDFWRIFPQKHVSKLEFGLAHYHSQKRPLSNAQQLHGTISIVLFRNFGGKGATFPAEFLVSILVVFGILQSIFLVDSRSGNLTVFS